jgi:hypothetical protein
MGQKPIDWATLSRGGEVAIRLIMSNLNRSISVEQAVVNLTTLVEIHMASTLETLIERERLGNSPFQDAILRDFRTDFYGGFDSLVRWLGNGFEVHIADLAETAHYRRCVDFRHMIVHGNSSLTRKQSAKFAEAISLRRELSAVLSLEFHGRRARPTASTRFKAVEVSRDFIVSFDREVLSVHPSLINNPSPLAKSGSTQ